MLIGHCAGVMDVVVYKNVRKHCDNFMEFVVFKKGNRALYVCNGVCSK